VLLVLMLQSGHIRQQMLPLEAPLDREALTRLSNKLSAQLEGRGLAGVREAALLALGVEREVARARDLPRSATAGRMLGLAEIEALLDGRLAREEAIRRIAMASGRYARRQRAWMRRLPGLVALDGRRPTGELADELAGQLTPEAGPAS
jgi:tRNA A37 N6-isopentenylltransferase MiaA